MKLVFSPAQYKYLARFCREVSQATIVGTFAAKLLPNAVGLETSLSIVPFSELLGGSLTILVFGIILEKKGEEK